LITLTYILICRLSGAPYTAIYTETIPTDQRGVFNAFASYQTIVVGFIISSLGAMMGENHLSDRGAYIISIAVCIFPTIPIGLVGLGEKPGWWAPEPMAPPPVEKQASSGCGVRARLSLADFVSAFQFRPFRWLFITNALNTVYGQICGLFFIYWCEPCTRARLRCGALIRPVLYQVGSTAVSSHFTGYFSTYPLIS
jgi:Na+/melibiose symporter-like transporter